MDFVDNDRKKGIDAITDQNFEVAYGFLLTHLQMEPIFDLQNRFIGLQLDVWDVGVDHEAEEVEDEVGGFTERRVGREAVLLKGAILGGFRTSHPVNHFFAELHHGCKGLGVTAQYEAEIGMEETTCDGGQCEPSQHCGNCMD